MRHVFVRIKLEDYARWRPVFGEFAGLRKTVGSKGAHLFQKSDSPDEVVLLFEWDSVEKARQYFQSEELRRGMQRAGVSGPPDVQYLSEVEKLSA